MTKKRAIANYIQRHGKKFLACKDEVVKNAYVTSIGDGKWRVRCIKHHRVSCRKIMRRLRKAA